MKNRGYTLLELLSVIIILALITTLVFPNVLNAIKRTTDKTDKLSMELISNAADLYIENHANKFVKFNGNKYIIEIESLIDEGNLPSNIKISDIDNLNDMCVQVTYQDGFNYKLKEKNSCEKLIQFDSICKIASDSTLQGIKEGAKYNCKVDPNRDTYTFYVLKTPKEGDTTVNLIMNQNINSDGTPAGIDGVTKETNIVRYNLVEWSNRDDFVLSQGTIVPYDELTCTDTNGCLTIEKGPITAMNFLQVATKNWTNASELVINSYYDNRGNSYEMKTYNTYARLPIYSFDAKSEVADKIETNSYLYENLGTNEGETNGYWTSSYEYDYFQYAYFICNSNDIIYSYIDMLDVGVRPVITIPIKP